MKRKRLQLRCSRTWSEPLEARRLLAAVYSVVDLGAGTTYAELNNNYALGYTGTASNPTGLSVYNISGQTLNSPPPVPPETVSLVGNDNGILAGTVNTNYQNPNETESDQGFVLNELGSTQPVQLQVVPSAGSAPTGNGVDDINDNGQILGDASEGFAGGYDEAVIWSTSGVVLQTFGEAGVDIEPAFINSAGVICGTDDQGGTQNGFIMQGSLPHNFATGVGEVGGINSQNHVLYESEGSVEAYLYNGGGDVDLGSFVPDGLNDSDAVVGFTTNMGLNDQAIIEQNGQITPLNSLIPANSGWNLTAANAINDAGIIIGTGTYNGVASSFLLQPASSYNVYRATVNGLPNHNLSSSAVGAFTYPGGYAATNFTASINWGDGSTATRGTITLANGRYTVNANHVYDTGKTYNITITVNGPNASTAIINSTAQVQATFVVNSDGTLPDSNLSDGIAWTGDKLKNGQLEVTLLAALQQANANGGAIIEFDLPEGKRDIPLPSSVQYLLGGNVVIEGSGVTLVGPGRDVSSAAGSQNGLTLSGNNNTVENLSIENMPGWGIQVNGGGGNVIQGCKFNLNGSPSNYTLADATFSGGDLEISNSSMNQIGSPHDGNTFSGEAVIGVNQGRIVGSAELLVDGTSSSGNVVQDNSFLSDVGRLPKGIVQNGTPARTAAASYGIFLSGAGNTIGGGAEIDGNKFDGTPCGICIEDNGRPAANNVVAGNTLQHCSTGIEDDSASNTIGGTGGGSGNKITSGTIGILLQSNASGSVVQSNVLTTCAIGVEINANNVIVGSPVGMDGNVISHGHGSTSGEPGKVAAGVAVLGGDGNTIIGNSIFDNVGLGIDLGDNGPTPNGSGDFGPNDYQNYPVFAPKYSQIGTVSGSSSQINLGLEGSASATYTISVYLCAPATAKNPYGQGKSFLGNFQVTTDLTGSYSGSITIPETKGSIVMTATDADGSTSEFSQAIALGLLPHVL